MSTQRKQSIFIDNCAWDILYSHKINLSKEFPFELFDLAMTKEIFSFEIKTIPNQSMQHYVQEQIILSQIREDSFFGFSDYESSTYQSRVSGFNEGRWMSYEEAAIYEKFKQPQNNQRPTGLYKNEADASLAARSLTGNIVLTAERLNKKGPIKRAIELGGKFINITEYNPAESTFSMFISQKINSLK